MGEEIGGEVRRAASLDVFFMKRNFMVELLLVDFLLDKVLEMAL